MTARTYRAETMAAALAKVKRDFGRRAVILRTRTVRTGGLFGLGGRQMIEITAGTDGVALEDPPEAVRTLAAEPQSAVSVRRAILERAAPAPPPAAHPRTRENAAPRDAASMHDELQDLKLMIQDLVKDTDRQRLSALPQQLQEVYTTLIQNQVAEELAAQFIRQLQESCRSNPALDVATVRELLIQNIARIMAPASPIRLEAGSCRVVALVGATGVGKTTTVAKLAAHFRLKQGKKVGLVTIDTYRIAAVDQLRTYAKIIDIPLEVVLTPLDLKRAVKRLRGCDVILIDTAGRGQFDTPRLQELKQFLEAAQVDETHLVLSANASPAVLAKSVEKFSEVGVNRIIFSKMDEAVGIGTLLSVLQKVDARLSYVTTGQDVPDDLEVGDGRHLAQLILKEGVHHEN